MGKAQVGDHQAHFGNRQSDAMVGVVVRLVGGDAFRSNMAGESRREGREGVTTERQRANWWRAGWSRAVGHAIRSDGPNEERARRVGRRLGLAQERAIEVRRVEGAEGCGDASAGGLGAARVVGKK